MPPGARWLALAAAVALALGAGAWFAGRQLLASPATVRFPTPMARRQRTVVAPGGTFEISYPSTWRRLPDNQPGVVLLASGAGGSMLVRETPLSAPVTTTNFSSAEQLASRIVNSGPGVKLLRPPQAVTLGGLPGLLYLYTFTDSQTGQVGAHAHYFLFDRATMITLVFQAVPAARILTLAPLFDRIAATFHLLRP
jgi:hypothetical protein